MDGSRCDTSFLTKCNAILGEECRNVRNKCDLNAKSLCICSTKDEKAGARSSEQSDGGDAGFSEAGFSEQITISTNLKSLHL